MKKIKQTKKEEASVLLIIFFNKILQREKKKKIRFLEERERTKKSEKCRRPAGQKKVLGVRTTKN